VKITIKDIARDLKLSKTTVSFVLAGTGTSRGISLKTQERILKFAKENGYQPNLLAKSLFSGKSFTLGVVVPSIGDLFYAELVRECEIEAKKHGYILTICSSEREVEQEVKMIRMLKTKQVDGLILAPTEHCQNELRQLLKEDFPFVLIDRYYPELETNCVVIDDEQTSFALTKGLIEKGKKRIALISPDTHITTVTLRKKGYMKALENAGIEFDSNLYCEVRRNDYRNDIIKKLDELFSKDLEVDGFYFVTHYLALETILYFFRNKINSERFGLACIHRNPLFSTLAPHMDVAAIPLDEMGSKAIQILLNDMNAEQTKEKKIRYEIVLSDEIQKLQRSVGG